MPETVDHIPSILSGLDHQQIQFLEGLGNTVRVREGQKIVAEGEPGFSIYVVLEGSLEVRKSFDGPEAPLRRLEAGAFFGEHALFHHSHLRTASVYAATSARLLRLDLAPAHILDNLLDQRLAITVMTNLLRCVAARLELPALLPRTGEGNETVLYVKLPEDAGLLFAKFVGLMAKASPGVRGEAKSETLEEGLELEIDHSHERFWILEEGSIVRELEPGGRRIEYFAPAIVGLYAALAGGRYTYRVRCQTQVRLRRAGIGRLRPKGYPRDAVDRLALAAGLVVAQIGFVEES